ncbi:hypothetical protein F4820DRAFT_424717 [Hypoxylon rubiginosum]|uniref:Uncharacterized protein n=1 Tax=Hypoxylon rubiginosum TaxID=110542 RepID=A0ACB9YXR0_9PEZI|nr:hypothetical protein F4820DRAFT_424717 [Hypoxylon rubiginosum]
MKSFLFCCLHCLVLPSRWNSWNSWNMCRRLYDEAFPNCPTPSPSPSSSFPGKLALTNTHRHGACAKRPSQKTPHPLVNVVEENPSDHCCYRWCTLHVHPYTN